MERPPNKISDVSLISPEQMVLIAQEFSVSPEEAERLVLEGLHALASYSIGGVHLLVAPDETKRVDADKPVRLLTGRKGVKGFSIVFNTDRLLGLVGSSEEEGRRLLKMCAKRGDIEYEQYYDEWVDDESGSPIEFCPVVFENDRVPLLRPTFNYGLYDGTDKLCAILPFESSVVDERIVDEGLSEIFPEGIYFRNLSKPGQEDRVAFMRLAHEIADIVASTNQQTRVPSLKRLSLILDEDGLQSTAIRRMGKTELNHNTILFSRSGLEGVGNDRTLQNRQSRSRHEYLHVLDNVLSKEGRYLSEEIAQELIDIVRSHLFSEKSVSIESDHVFTSRADRDKIERVFAERLFLAEEGENNGGLAGHPSESIRELLVSALNCYLDERFPVAAQRLAKQEGVDAVALFSEIFAVFERHIKELYEKER